MTTDIETTVRELEKRRFATIVAGDWDGFAALCDTDLRYVHASGAVDTRDSYLQKLRGGFYDYHRIDSAVDRVLVTPDVVLLHGTMSLDLRAGERELSLENILLSAWVRRDTSWLLYIHQSTGI